MFERNTAAIMTRLTPEYVTAVDVLGARRPLIIGSKSIGWCVASKSPTSFSPPVRSFKS